MSFGDSQNTQSAAPGGMAYDLATAKGKLGITDATQDAEVQAVLDAGLALAEAYCKREFMYKSETVGYYHVEAGYLFVPRYPIQSVTSVTGEDNTSIKYKVNKNAGFLDMHGRYSDEELKVTYSGGYNPLPDDLIIALFEIFNELWRSHTAIGGSIAPGPVTSATLTGVGTVRFGEDLGLWLETVFDNRM